MTRDTEFAAYIGLDWDHQKHAVYLWPANGGSGQYSAVPHTPEGIAAWVAELRERFGGRPVAICLEQSRGALVYALMQYDFLVLFPINPKQLSDYRQALYPSGAKSDPNDAELAARFLHDHSDKLRAWHPDDPITRSLRLMTEQRRKWVEDRVALTNELLQRLKESYVLALQFSGKDLARESFLALLEKFPSQRDLQRASPKQLEKWLPVQRRVADDPPAEEILKQRIALIRIAAPITTDPPVLEHGRLVVTNLVALIRVVNQSIAQCEERIDELFAKHPESKLFASFPGSGKALAPRLAAAFGTDRQKFRSAQDIQQLSGIAPVTKASGKTKVAHMRWACPKFLRQTFHEFAGCSIKQSKWAKAYVEMRAAGGHRYQETVRALAFKWQRILFHCWKTGQPYDEDRYLQRLHASGSKIIQFLATEPPKST
jgi:transposase